MLALGAQCVGTAAVFCFLLCTCVCNIKMYRLYILINCLHCLMSIAMVKANWIGREEESDKNEVAGSNEPAKLHHLPQDYAHMNAPDLIRRAGFPVESHKMTTADGYILTSHRIPNPGATPVVIMHGILCTSRDWLMQRETDALPFQLHLRGYDVWLGNMRGNNYSQEHESLSTRHETYWNFTVDHVSLYDVPTLIDHVLEVTNKSQIAWIGYSLGTTTLFSGLVARPEYQKKVKCFAALAPVTVKGHCRSHVVKILAALALPEQPLKGALDNISHGEFLPWMLSGMMHSLLPNTCTGSNGLVSAACEVIPQLIGGFNPNQVDKEMESVIYGGFPATISTGMLIQQLQSVGSGAGRFRRYHFQEARSNFNAYGVSGPPDIDLSQFGVPTILFCGLNDFLAPPEDVAFLPSRLSNIIHIQNVSDPSWTHLDFLYAKQAKTLVYDDLIAKLEICAPPKIHDTGS